MFGNCRRKRSPESDIDGYTERSKGVNETYQKEKHSKQRRANTPENGMSFSIFIIALCNRYFI